MEIGDLERMKDVLDALIGQQVHLFLLSGKEVAGKMVKAGMDFVSMQVEGQDTLFYVPFNAITHFKKLSAAGPTMTIT